MVLLESISSDYDGRCTGFTIDGKFFPIESVPHIHTISLYRRENIDGHLERLKKMAKRDESKYYIIQSKSEIMNEPSGMPHLFSIGYITFEK